MVIRLMGVRCLTRTINTYQFVWCVCVCVCACVRACVRACVLVRAYVRGCVRARVDDYGEEIYTHKEL